ncbi:MAG: hypothetical protein ABI626_02435 [Sphingomicrobium sp.]
MKIILGLAFMWLLCGLVAAGLIFAIRPVSMTEVLLGPVTLFRALVG